VRRAHDPAGDGSFDVEHRIVDRNGVIHWLSTQSRTHFEGEGSSRHPVRTVGAVADITERKSAEEVLKRYQLLSQKTRDIILFIRVSDGQIIEANQAAVQAYGYEGQELVTKNILDLHAPGTRRFVTEQIEQANASGIFFETLHCRKDGILFPVEVSSVGMSLGHSRVLLSIIRDITDRKQAEEQIMNSLNEKEMLLREIHHRVKNNMQVISSLLWLQSGYIKDKKYLEMFRDSQNRITSMSLIHEKLYRSKDLAKIEFSEYIRDLVNGLFQSHGVKTGTIVLNINVDNFSLGIDQAVPCGLLINELITNSLKYAFPEDRKGEINISLHLNDENMVELVVSDNGVGIPSDLDFRKTESLGLRLVTILAEDQLQGKIDLDRSRGTEFKIKFKG
jgi:PAS domain S-box-containing protein